MTEIICGNSCEDCPVGQMPLEKRKAVGSATRALFAADIGVEPPFAVMKRLASNGLEEEGFTNPDEIDTLCVALAVMKVVTHLECDNYRMFD